MMLLEVKTTYKFKMKKLICLLVIIAILPLSGCSNEPNENEVFMQNLYGRPNWD